MADIFISYSRRDSEHALALAERLRGAGASVWLDTAVLSAAETWSAEIVSAINTCKTFIILLSPDSVASHNVTKELSLASEKRKTIVPIVLAECTPNEAMEYALAGLQQVSLADEEALERAFAKLGITGNGFSQVVTPRAAAQKRNRLLVPLALVGILVLVVGAYFFLFSNGRSDVPSGVKTIAVLPFESLSADKENEYFTDGMTATLIDMLVSVPELRVIDRRTVMEYKSSTLDIKSLGTALESRYIVSGRVQRQGDEVMINAEMTDAETGTVLFSKSFSGKTNDLLDLQKQIAESIVVELQLAFNPDNSITFTSESRSRNPQAHEWCMKADYAEGHGELNTAIAYYLRATTHDSTFAFPYLSVSRLYGNLAMSDSALPRHITLADSFLAIGKRLDTAQRHSHHMASWVATVKGDYDLAIAEATAHIKKQPRKSEGYNALGLVYLVTKQYPLAAQNFTEELKRDPSSNQSRFYLMLSFWLARDTVRLHQCATQAIPIFEASLSRRPDDKDVRNNSIPLALVWSGRGDEACKRMEQLIKTPGVDSQYFLNTAAISALSGKLERAMELMRQEVVRLGVQNVDFERGFFDNIRNFPEFKAWEKQKEALVKKMADIFISYSSKDHAQAMQLTELLASAGLSVWIDKQGIQAASSWSEEIVHGIDGCRAFIVMLSPNSVESHNVVKESLASEKRKKILPLDLEPVEIPASMQYALAGIQRTPMTNIDAIIRAIGKLGLEATQAPTITLIKEIDNRKSLMILPFEDLSPTADNEWFADGIVSELINALTNVKSIRIADNQATKEFKHYHGQLSTYAKAMNIRYFVQGDVRKFGDQIKVSSRLLDIETGDHLWQDSMKGTMNDIFDIQEKVAESVVAGLKIHLTSEERKSLSVYTTDNPEAYELYLKADEYVDRHTKADYERAIGLLSEACRIDPHFANAHTALANCLIEIYRAYERNLDYLVQAEETINRMREIVGENALYACMMCKILVSRNELQEALIYAKQSIQYDPDCVDGYIALAFAYGALGDGEGELLARKEEIRLHENSLSARFNLLVTLDQLDRRSELREEAEHAIPLFRKRILLNPDDYSAIVQTACVLLMAGREDEAIGEAQVLSQHDGLDALACVNLASLYIHAHRPELASKEIARAIKKGFRGIEVFRQNPAAAVLLDDPEIVELIARINETADD